MDPADDGLPPVSWADTWVPLAEVARPHGVRGELRLRLFNADSDVLLEQEEVLVRMPEGEEHEVSVERARRADDAILIKLFSVDDRDRAEELRGAQVCVRRRDFPEADAGEFYAIDVVGGEVRLAGERIGTVAEIITYPSVEVLVVHADDGKGDWEVPLTEMFIGRVDVAAKLVELVTLDELERTPRRKDKVKEPSPEEPRTKGPRRGKNAGRARASKAGNAGTAGTAGAAEPDAAGAAAPDEASDERSE